MNYNICTYYVYWHYNCSFANLTNSEILAKLKREMLRTYPHDGLDTEVKALNGYAFQFTNSLNQLISNDSAFSNIDLGECERLLKETYGIPENISLIFFKFENIESSGAEKDIQYEVYSPLDYTQLNLSICTDVKITLTIYKELSDELIELIQNIIDQGYDPFDLSDKFYREICTPYNSENGTDVLLDDREEYIYNSIANATTCPTGCEMSSYSLDTKYITCECSANDTGIVELDLHHISASNVYNSIVSSLKNSNYKVMLCYNLVFNFKIFCHNYGSIITLILFVAYVIFMIYYCCKDITPIKVSVSKIVFDEEKKVKENIDALRPYFLQDKSTKSEKKSKKSAKTSKTSKTSKTKKRKENRTNKDAPPKKLRVKKDENNSFERKKGKDNHLKLVDILKKKRHSIKNKKKKDDQESIKSDKVRKRKSIIDYQNELILKTRENLINAETVDN